MTQKAALVLAHNEMFVHIDQSSGGYPCMVNDALQAHHFHDSAEGREKAEQYRRTISAGSDTFKASQWVVCRLEVVVTPLEKPASEAVDSVRCASGLGIDSVAMPHVF